MAINGLIKCIGVLHPFAGGYVTVSVGEDYTVPNGLVLVSRGDGNNYLVLTGSYCISAVGSLSSNGGINGSGGLARNLDGSQSGLADLLALFLSGSGHAILLTLGIIAVRNSPSSNAVALSYQYVVIVQADVAITGSGDGGLLGSIVVGAANHGLLGGLHQLVQGVVSLVGVLYVGIARIVLGINVDSLSGLSAGLDLLATEGLTVNSNGVVGSIGYNNLNLSYLVVIVLGLNELDSGLLSNGQILNDEVLASGSLSTLNTIQNGLSSYANGTSGVNVSAVNSVGVGVLLSNTVNDQGATLSSGNGNGHRFGILTRESDGGSIGSNDLLVNREVSYGVVLVGLGANVNLGVVVSTTGGSQVAAYEATCIVFGNVEGEFQEYSALNGSPLGNTLKRILAVIIGIPVVTFHLGTDNTGVVLTFLNRNAYSSLVTAVVGVSNRPIITSLNGLNGHAARKRVEREVVAVTILNSGTQVELECAHVVLKVAHQVEDNRTTLVLGKVHVVEVQVHSASSALSGNYYGLSKHGACHQSSS